MPLQVVCPNPQCRKPMMIKDELVGQALRCPACKTTLTTFSRSDAPAASKHAKDRSTIQAASAPKKNTAADPLAQESTPSESAGAATCKASRGGQREELPARIGPYEITQELGRGAFGVVYKGHDPKLKRDVAIKVLNRNALHSTKAVERFLREAQVVAQMHHNHIVPVYELGEYEECHYIASRFIPGKTLADLIPEEGMGAIEAVGLVLQLLEALTYAHEMNVLHRDIKPANAIVDAKGHLYLVDFGLAGWVSQTEGRATQLGTVMGTPFYMAPEQARGDINNVHETADQYSAGVVLYEMLTGHVPFEGGPTVVLLHNVINTPPPRPSEFRVDLDPQLEEICLKALAKTPEERYPSCLDLADALRTWKTARGSPLPIAVASIIEPTPRPEPAAQGEAGVELVFADIVDTASTRKTHEGALSGDEASSRSSTRKKGRATTALVVAGPADRKPEERSRRSPLSGMALAALKWSRRRLIALLAAAGLLVTVLVAAGVVSQVMAWRQRQAETRRLEEAEREATEKREEENRRKQVAAEKARMRQEQARAVAASLRVEPETAAVIWCGRNTSLLVRLQRNGYLGEIRVRVDGLPNQVQLARPVVIPAGQENVRIDLVASAVAPEAEAEVTVSATLDEAQGKSRLRLQVRNPLRADIAECLKLCGVGENSSSFIEKSVALRLAGWQAAANQGSPEGQWLLGRCLELGAGIAKNEVEAVQWYRKAAERDLAIAQNNLGICYCHGQGVARDEMEAVQWLRKAADQGYAPAQYNLALCYARGKGVARDELQAIPWLRKATDQGNLPAKEMLKQLTEQDNRLLFSLKGHTSQVYSVAFSADGKRIVSGSGDNTVKVWDADTGTEMLTLKGHKAGVYSVAFSPDGKRILSGSDDWMLKVWDAEKGSDILSLKEHRGGVTSVAFSPDGKRILSGGFDKTVKVWDAEKGTELLCLKGHTIRVMSVAYSPDGKRIVSGSGGYDTQGRLLGEVKVWDAEKGTETLSLKGYISTITSVAFTPDGKGIVTGSWDRTARVWDAETGTEKLALKGHTGIVYSVAFSPDGKRIVTGSQDNTVRVWDAETGTEKLALKGHAGGVSSVAFSPDGKRILSGGVINRTGEVQVWYVPPEVVREMIR
jgi:WD40 repeat protein/serine/threonine protein kinase